MLVVIAVLLPASNAQLCCQMSVRCHTQATPHRSLYLNQPVAAQVFFAFAVITNLLVSLSMLQGCVSVINTLTNVNVYAISFLIPLGVVVYATIGGAPLHLQQQASRSRHKPDPKLQSAF